MPYCNELASTEQILAEFKVRALECHPDKHPENSKAVETFQKLQKAKEILTNAERRAHYDHWRRSQMSTPFEQWKRWPTLKTSMHWAVRSKKDLMLKGAEQTSTNTVQNKDRNEQGETKKREPDSTTEKMMHKESGSPEKATSPHNPGSPGLSDLNCGCLPSFLLVWRRSLQAPEKSEVLLLSERPGGYLCCQCGVFVHVLKMCL
ncbi:hypothetical protein HispidOSU_000359 [Sigmodon hispidus]